MLSAIVEKADRPGSESSAGDLLGRVTRILINISHQLISRIAHRFPAGGLNCELAETSRDGCSVARSLAALRATLLTPERECVFVCVRAKDSSTVVFFFFNL